jgi:hypothetical protein
LAVRWPIFTQNPLFSDHTPPDHDWGYDPVQLFAVKSKYGTQLGHCLDRSTERVDLRRLDAINVRTAVFLTLALLHRRW